MADKEYRRFAENFKGVNYGFSDLTRPAEYLKDALNYQFSTSRSLQGRRGVQIFGQFGNFVALHTYSYFDPQTGATKHELLALNDNLWRLKTGSFDITRTGGSTDWDYQMRVDSATSTYKFVINQAGVPYFTFDCGHGLEHHSTIKTVKDLRDAIDATANFSATALPRTAIVNGTQTSTRNITVDAGHSFAVRDVLFFWNHRTDQTRLTARIVSATTATSVSFASSSPVVNVVDNQTLGVGSPSAATIPINDPFANSADTLTVMFYYWDWVPGPGYDRSDGVTSRTPFDGMFALRNSVDFQQPVFINANNVCYIFTKISGNAAAELYHGYPFKYDGQRVYRAGVPPYRENITDSTSAGSLTGVYKYAVRFVHKDAKGIYTYGNESAIYKTKQVTLSGQQATLGLSSIKVNTPNEDTAGISGNQTGVSNITVGAGHTLETGDIVGLLDRNTSAYILRTVVSTTATTINIGVPTVNVNNADKIYKNPHWYFNDGGAQVDGTQTGVSTVTVFSTGHDVQVGDHIFLFDRKLSKYVDRVVTAITSTSISWDPAVGDVVNVNNGDRISRGMRLQIFRTKAGGNVFYFVDEIVHPNFPIWYSTFLYTDNKADSALGHQLDTSAIGYERDLPPRASIACLHQGLLVYSGMHDEPNTVAFSLPEELEAVPLASNYFDVPSNVSGTISAIGSDTGDRLAVFKPDAYYDVPGNLPGNNFSVLPIREGDYGVSSHSSLCKIRGTLVGLGKLGFIGVEQGVLSEVIGYEINPAIAGNHNLLLSQSTAVVDATTMQYRCYIPGVRNSAFSISDRKMYVLDYRKMEEGLTAWFPWEYRYYSDSSRMFGCSGPMTVGNMPITIDNESDFMDVVVMLSRHEHWGQVFKELHIATPEQNFADNCLPIQYRLWLTPEMLENSRVNKQFQQFAIYTLYNEVEAAQFTPFTFTVTTYRNFQDTTSHSNFQWSFAATTEFEKLVNLLTGQARALSVKFETETVGQRPHITGWEWLIAAPYALENFRK